MTMQPTGLFVYVKPTKKVGLLVGVQVIVQRVPAPATMNAQKLLIQPGPNEFIEQLVPIATVALKDGFWGGPLGETLPVWEETEMDALNSDAPQVTLAQFEQDLAAAEAAAQEGEQDGSEGDVQGAGVDGAGDASVPE